MAADFAERLITAEDEAASQLEKAFLKSVSITLKETDWEKLERNLQAYADGEKIIDGIAWEDYDPKEVLKKLLEVSMDIHGEYIGDVAGGAKFDYIDPNALKWLEDYGVSEIKYISESQREAIKSIVLDGYENGITPSRQAQQIRHHIGLDPRRSEALTAYGESLFEKGMAEDEVWRLMERRGKELLNDRALGIALNETSEASGRATYEGTKSACERGILDPHFYEGFRIITGDERTCEVCIAVEGEARKLPDGVYPSSGSQIAKKHNRCRCVEGLREVSMKKKQMKQSGKGYADIIFEAKGLKRKDGIIYCPTVPLVEGVYNGWGIPVLREYSEFSKDSKWLNGLTILTNHEDLTPEARRIGQLMEIANRPEGKKVGATTQFYEIDLTQREIDKILSREPINGSLSFSCFLEMTPGEWTSPTCEIVHYEAIERGPYVFYEYSMVRQGVVTPEDGAGFNVECKNCKSKSSAHRAVRGKKMEGVEDTSGHEPELKEQLDTALKELGAVKAELKTVKEGQTKMAEDMKVKEQAAALEKFASKLKPGHEAKAAELFAEYQKDPATWVLENADKFVQRVQEKGLKGSPHGEGDAPSFDLAKEQDKLWGRVV